MRALQLKKAVLLEGSPGVGKTSLIAALAKQVGIVFPATSFSFLLSTPFHYCICTALLLADD
jgi:MoxR-like ATPase